MTALAVEEDVRFAGGEMDGAKRKICSSDCKIEVD